MALENDKIKDLFSSKLNNFEADVPTSVWSAIDLLLPQIPTPAMQAPDASSVSSSSSSSSAGTSATTLAKASVVKTIAIGVGVATAVTLGVVLIPDKEPQIENDDKQITVVEEPKDSLNVEEIPLDTIVPLFFTRPSLDVKPEIAEVVEVMDIPDAEEPYLEPADNNYKRDKEPVFLPTPAVIKDPVERMPKKKTRLLGFRGNFALLSENSIHKYSDILFSNAVRSQEFKSLLNEENTIFELHHRQPISLGITLGKKLDPRFSIETGLIYTDLYSTITSSSIYNIEETQRFYYLGIPLYLNYTFYKTSKANFYLSVGGLVQKDVHGYYISNLDIAGSDLAKESLGDLYYSEPYHIKSSIRQSNPQFSVHGSLGAYYPLYKNVSVYGAFGGAYFFDAGNKYRTIYSDRKFQLDLNVGIRLGF